MQAIDELIEHLDQQKDEAIARTFKQVSTYVNPLCEDPQLSGVVTKVSLPVSSLSLARTREILDIAPNSHPLHHAPPRLRLHSEWLHAMRLP